MKHVALLRGVNVGGKNKLPMKDLTSMFIGAGCRDVSTYIQSGNVVFSAPATVLKKVPAAVSTKIADRFGYNVPVVIRSHEELATAIQSNPFPEAVQEGRTLYVAFLADVPHMDAVAKLDPNRSPPDRFVVIGRDVYLHLLNHAAKTKLSTVSTARNWNTVLKLHEMTQP